MGLMSAEFLGYEYIALTGIVISMAVYSMVNCGPCMDFVKWNLYDRFRK